MEVDVASKNVRGEKGKSWVRKEAWRIVNVNLGEMKVSWGEELTPLVWFYSQSREVWVCLSTVKLHGLKVSKIFSKSTKIFLFFYIKSITFFIF
jgi:hypothetical protein